MSAESPDECRSLERILRAAQRQKLGSPLTLPIEVAPFQSSAVRPTRIPRESPQVYEPRPWCLIRRQYFRSAYERSARESDALLALSHLASERLPGAVTSNAASIRTRLENKKNVKTSTL